MNKEASNKAPFLKVRNLTKMFGSFTALKDISLDVDEGEFVCFLGPSGCGKTTFLRAIAGLDIQTAGTIEQAGIDISALPPAKRDFGIVFQSYALFPNLTVEKNIAYGLENSGRPRSAVKARVEELLELVGLPEQAKKYPTQLSGGQQQRIALARAIATSPGLLLLDEPLSALDAKVRTHLRHEIKDLQDKLGITTIMVTHDQEEALTMADRIVVMDHGVIEQSGSPQDIYSRPASLFVADFIGEMNQIEAVATSDDAITIGSLTLKCRPHGRKKGTPGIATIRPEDIETVNAAEKRTGGNVIKVTTGEMEFLGSFWRVFLGGGKLGDARLTADISINAARQIDIAQGKPIKIELPAGNIQFFAGKAAS